VIEIVLELDFVTTDKVQLEAKTRLQLKEAGATTWETIKIEFRAGNYNAVTKISGSIVAKITAANPCNAAAILLKKAAIAAAVAAAVKPAAPCVINTETDDTYGNIYGYSNDCDTRVWSTSQCAKEDPDCPSPPPPPPPTTPQVITMVLDLDFATSDKVQLEAKTRVQLRSYKIATWEAIKLEFIPGSVIAKLTTCPGVPGDTATILKYKAEMAKRIAVAFKPVVCTGLDDYGRTITC